ncbi:signal peptide peptidase-like 2B isoform X4 [Xenopus laevis]|uniref:Signal peptide peptidase-like 2B n=1 Tax=Xenopus laevis TaxID=8355 RepID=A0A8J1KL04_XENLA|nr:signal peptide peptidase-like 2B isoform X4 [Xenopus laevis]
MSVLTIVLSLGFFVTEVVSEYGMVHVTSEKSSSSSKDYCILFNSQWAPLPQDLAKAGLLQLQNETETALCSPSDVPERGFINRIPMVMRGNCTFYEKVRLAQINGARGLLIVSRERLVPPGGNQSQFEEKDIPVALLSYSDMLDIGKTFGKSVKVAMYAPNEPVLDYNMVIIFLMAVGTVAVGGYWAGSRDVKKRYMKHKRDDGSDKKLDDETVDVTPIMICVFVVMCCSMLVLLYYFYDHLVYVIIGIFCLAASVGLYSCLSPFVHRFPYGKCRVPDNNLPYFHKRPPVWKLLLAAFCIVVSVIWGVYRNEDEWAWVLQDILGIAFCLYMLKTIRMPTFKGCTLLLFVLFIYDVFFVFITPYLTKMHMTLPSQKAWGEHHGRSCFWAIKLYYSGKGLLVAYCHRFDIQMQSSRIYFVACTIAYGIGLLVTFVALALMQKGQPALLYLVPCTLLTSLAVALWRKELHMFWTGSGFVQKDLPRPPLVVDPSGSDACLGKKTEDQEHEEDPDRDTAEPHFSDLETSKLDEQHENPDKASSPAEQVVYPGTKPHRKSSGKDIIATVPELPEPSSDTSDASISTELQSTSAVQTETNHVKEPSIKDI